MIIVIIMRLTSLWNKLLPDKISQMLLLPLINEIFVFCPLIKTDYNFKSIRNGVIFNLFIFIVAALMILFTPLSWLFFILFGGYTGLEIYKYCIKKSQARKFLTESDSNESYEMTQKIISPILEAHRLLCIYQIYLMIFLFIIYTARP